MNLNRRAILLVVSGLVAALAATVVVFLLASNIRQAQNATAAVPVEPTQAPGKTVVVAATDIGANTVITNAQLTTASYPADLVPADAITDTAIAVHSTSKVNVFSGQILLQRQFLAANGRTGASVSIPPGKVLVAFPSTDMLNATGAVQAGDHVDILLSMPISGTTRLDNGASTGSQEAAGGKSLVVQGTLQNIEVYTVGFWSPPGQGQGQPAAGNAKDNGLKIITFIVDHQEALILKYVKDSGGTIDLAVRSAEDKNIVQTDPVTLDYLVDLYGFVGLNPNKPKP